MKNDTKQSGGVELSLDEPTVMAMASQFLAMEIFLESLMQVTPAPECREQQEVMEMGKGLLENFKRARESAGIEVKHDFFPSKGNN